ncbi:MAG: hypothetical protein Q9169_001282 [Polycauliona sp. 2 TL-2023]
MALGSSNAATPGLSRPSSRSGPTRGPAQRATSRGSRGPSLSGAPSRQVRGYVRPSPPERRDVLRDATTQDQSVYKKYMETTFTTLGEQRTQERKDAITDGLLADPDKPTTLANAITIVGTCQHMCAEYERVQRVVQFMVDDCEKVQHSKENIRVPSEDRMVKRYRRPAAGYEEQLPSDIRPPHLLQKTLDYLVDDVVGGPDPLSKVHKFVWDRTRAIRNDFSIQQVTKVEEIRIAISCFERIARFHILSLHQLAGTSENSVDFDAYQEREQLNNTLLSLIYYYDDSRHRIVSPNEPEFRAYCIIFEVQDQRPDLEDRAQNWAVAILKDRRVQTALKLYAAAASASDPQGPLRPQALHAIAQANTPTFFAIVLSPAVPYLMACVAEIYFNKVRRMALDTIWKAYKTKRGGNASIEDWTLTGVTSTLGFDDEEQAQTFCEEHGLAISEKEGGETYVDLGSVAGRYLSDANPRRKQPFSFNLVEQKRRGRTLPAIINGLTAAQAQAQGLVVDDTYSNEGLSADNEESLFLQDQTHSTGLAQAPKVNGILPGVTSTQEEKSEVTSEASPPFPFNPSAPSFITSENSDDTPTRIWSFGKPSEGVSSQAANPFASPSFNIAKPANYSPFSELNKSETQPNPFGNLKEPDPTPSLFSNVNRADPDAPSFTSSGSTGQADQIPLSMAPSSSSIFDPKPFSAADSAKISFETSPFFSQNDAKKSAQPGAKDGASPFSFAASAPSAAAKPQPSASAPESSLKANSITPPSTLPLQAPTDNVEERPVQRSLPPPFSFTAPPSAPASGSPFRSPQQFDKPPTKSISDSTKPTTTPSASFSFPQFKTAVNPPEQPIVETSLAATNSLLGTHRVASPQSQPSNVAVAVPKAAVAPPPPDPRPGALDALAESLMMDRQGLLEQFIEYIAGPIVHHAFLEVEEDRSWSQAREIRTGLLSRKYLRRWKDNVWAKKLLRKGKERRATFARSMQQMAKSSRLRHSQSKMPSHLNANHQGSVANNVQRSHMAPPPPPPSAPKRTSLPTDFPNAGDKLPNAETNKRKRQEPPTETQRSRQSLRSSIQPHHKRSRTMGDSQGTRSVYDALANFSQLDENTYDNETVLHQARRLVGRAKLDTTRGDYFALKSRGIDPDTPLLPQPGTKRTRVDDQIERVQKLLKPSSPTPFKSAQPGQLISQSNILAPQDVRVHHRAASPSGEKGTQSPGDLLAQIRQVREALAEGTAWFQAEREKSERLSSRHSSDVPMHASVQSQGQSQSQPSDTQPQERRHVPTRAQIRLERTRADGLLAPDWDWNKSVTEWKLRGGTGSMRASSDGDQSGTSTPAAAQQKKPIGFAAVINGLGRRPVKVPDADEEIYNDGDHASDEGAILLNGGGAVQDGGYLDDGANGYDSSQGPEYEDEEDEEDEEEDEQDDETSSPEREVLQGQGSSADTAIDLD